MTKKPELIDTLAEEARRSASAHDGNTSDTHDPGTYVTFSMIQVAHTYRSYLTLIEPDGSLGPDVATEWSASPDATEWTFKLNDRATFHSGPR
jgi:peptide/nickel transport system substrate-binding protein